MKQKTIVRYSDADLMEFKRLIDRKLMAARQEVADIKEQIQQISETTGSEYSFRMDDATDNNMREHLVSTKSRQEKFIRDLELALDRIVNKTYGICRVTGKLIDKRRLLIVPHATLSMKAKMSQAS